MKKRKRKQAKVELCSANKSLADEYCEIHLLNADEILHVTTMIRTKSATETEKVEYEKYWFESKINPSLPAKDKATLFFLVFLPSHKKQQFINAWRQNKKSVESALKQDSFNSCDGFELNKMTGVQMRYVNELSDILRLDNEQSKQLISKETLHESTAYLQANRKEIHLAFGMRDQAKLTGSMDLKGTLKFIQKNFAQWNGSSIKGQTKNTHTKNYDDFLFVNIFPRGVFFEDEV